MDRRPTWTRRLSVLICPLALACSEPNLPTEPTDAGRVWSMAARVDTTAADPFVLAAITVHSTPADTSYVHLTVQSPDFATVDFVALRLPDTPGTGADSLMILGELPIWTDWLLVVDVWSQHTEVRRDSVRWDGVGGAPGTGTAPSFTTVIGDK